MTIKPTQARYRPMGAKLGFFLGTIGCLVGIATGIYFGFLTP
ncbi:hypothetical protein [Robiginitomaculum antarcticum]|nr:hypothetical protein [Robiginitomaculum antarcticum]